MGNDPGLGNDTIANDSQSVMRTKEFVSAYIGYYSTEVSDWYLAPSCPKTANHTFMVRDSFRLTGGSL